MKTKLYLCPDCKKWFGLENFLTDHKGCKLVKRIIKKMDEECIKKIVKDELRFKDPSRLLVKTAHPEFMSPITKS